MSPHPSRSPIRPLRRTPSGGFRTTLAAGAALTLSCGGESAAPSDTPVEESLIAAPAETLVSMESGLIGMVVDIRNDPDGRIYFLDAQAHAVQALDPDGTHLRTIGREGQGPGEFFRPSGILIRADSVLVVDGGNRRVQLFSRDGEFMSSRPLPAGQAPVIGPEGLMVRATLGLDSVLAVVHAPDGEELARIGEMAAPLMNPIIISQLKQEIADGSVPGMFLNAVTPVIDDESKVWLLTSASGLLEKYEPSGERLLSKVLSEPEFEAAYADFVTRNAEAAANQLFGLQYIRSARAVGTDLWLLLNTGEDGPATLLVLSDDGENQRKLRFTGVRGAGNFAVDADRDLVYFVITERAELVRVALEPVE